MQRRSLLINALLAVAGLAAAAAAFSGFIGLKQMSLHGDVRVYAYYLCVTLPFLFLLLFRSLRTMLLSLAACLLSAWTVETRISWLNCHEGTWCEPYTLTTIILGCLSDPSVSLSLLATLCVFVAWLLDLRGQAASQEGS